MIVLFAVLAVLFSIVAFPYVYLRARQELDARRYQQCLRNIERLERELFPERFPQPIRQGQEFFELKPGARWRVDDPEAVLFIDPQADPQWKRWGVEHGMMYSAEWERAKIEWLEDA